MLNLYMLGNVEKEKLSSNAESVGIRSHITILIYIPRYRPVSPKLFVYISDKYRLKLSLIGIEHRA